MSYSANSSGGGELSLGVECGEVCAFDGTQFRPEIICLLSMLSGRRVPA